jgi:alkylated DNA repair protein (DNA oxidative demethylase)
MRGLEIAPGAWFYPGLLDLDEQSAILSRLRTLLVEGPLFVPTMPRSGKPLTVRMTNLGPLGWVSDRDGYRYQATHPETAGPWPPIPEEIAAIWRRLLPGAPPPEACLVNYYAPSAKMGLHQDRDEQAFDVPVLSISLGDSALFRVGGLARSAPTRSFRLNSGDVVTLGGASRLAFHGVDRILPGTSTLLPEGGRFNLTLRRVSAA